ncbi:PREDICTED: breast cancer type 2 susceptibility protein homolog [Priapulus caudatus]|uniref:Breast cancer type 2 susceptibility protein homolog n=1 Tax=Priapulus caudatus TaxID=37621 RepID=A0ABM1E3Y0_PRICU|nr:PREDICTED: breast cancer type 2 susceptibility protein homolog [Priapulus caudatus]
MTSTSAAPAACVTSTSAAPAACVTSISATKTTDVVASPVASPAVGCEGRASALATVTARVVPSLGGATVIADATRDVAEFTTEAIASSTRCDDPPRAVDAIPPASREAEERAGMLEERTSPSSLGGTCAPAGGADGSPPPGAVAPSVAAREARELAAMMQEMRIKKKERQRVRAVKGTWLRRKLSRRRTKGRSLREVVSGAVPGGATVQQFESCGGSTVTLSVTSASAEEYRFNCLEHFSRALCDNAEGARIADGALLVFAVDSTVGKQEFCRALMDSPGVDPKLISMRWVYNHYRWIVWKLAALEVAFPQQFAGWCLTPDVVMHQLKYRYDVEIDAATRPTLRRITERDDAPGKTMVLCVSSVAPSLVDRAATVLSRSDAGVQGATPATGAVSAGVQLTDGWYSIRAVLDAPLTALVRAGRVAVGDKLCIQGAELTGTADGCHPLEVTNDVALKLSANSTRRARWDSRLGYQQGAGRPFAVPLRSLYADGGVVSCLELIVCRTYPLQYMEKMPDGSTVFRSEKAEASAASAHAVHRQRKLEDLYAKLLREQEKQDVPRRAGMRGFERQQIEALRTGEEIHNALAEAGDPAIVRARLDGHQVSLLETYAQQLQERRRGEMEEALMRAQEEEEEKQQMPMRRNSVSLYRVRVIGVHPHDVQKKTDAMLTAWRPGEELLQLLSEGRPLRVFYLGVSASRSRFTSSAVQLTTTRATRYEEMTLNLHTLCDIYQPRHAVPLSQLHSARVFAHDEVDVVGLVVHVALPGGVGRDAGSGRVVQTAYLCDGSANFLAVKFWGGLQRQGCPTKR